MPETDDIIYALEGAPQFRKNR